MQINMLVLEEAVNSFNTKTGVKKEKQLSLRDQSPGVRCKTNFTYALSDEEADKYSGKLRDQVVTVHVSDMRAGFQGEIRLSGHLEVAPKK